MRDFTLPGYRYLGPGNKMDKGPPTSWDDLVSWFHDKEYEKLEAEGINPYYTYSKADQTFREQLAYDYPHYGGILGQISFTAKKLLSDIGVLPTHGLEPHGNVYVV